MLAYLVTVSLKWKAKRTENIPWLAGVKSQILISLKQS